MGSGTSYEEEEKTEIDKTLTQQVEQTDSSNKIAKKETTNKGKAPPSSPTSVAFDHEQTSFSPIQKKRKFGTENAIKVPTFANHAANLHATKKNLNAERSKIFLEQENKTPPKITNPIEIIDLSEYQKFSPQEIIERDLIAKAAKEKNLEAASFMVDGILESEIEGKDVALKNGFLELITSFPSIAAEADKPRGEAFITLNKLNKEFANIDKLSINDEKIVEVMNRPDFIKSNSRLKSSAAAEELKRAQDILKTEITPKIEEAKKNYETEKSKAIEKSKNFENTITKIAGDVDLTDVKLPKLDEYSAEQKDIVFKALGRVVTNFCFPN